MDKYYYLDWLGDPVSEEEAERMMAEYLSYTAGIDPE